MQVVHYLIEEMNAENSTTDTTPSNITTTEPPAGFFDFDPTWDLAVTIEFYFQYAIIAIGVFGAAANAAVFYALVAYHLQETKKRAVNLLMINQNLLDLTSCILLVITFSVNVSNVYLSGGVGYFLCTVFVSQNAANSTLNASIINLKASSHYAISFHLISSHLISSHLISFELLN